MPQDKLPEPGEFTRLFKRQQMKAQNPNGPLEGEAPAAAPALPLTSDSTPPTSDPGEFTKYLSGSLPAKRSPAGVQRPNTPVPRPVPSDSSGTFGNGPAAQVKSGDGEYGINNPLYGAAPDLGRPFDPQASVPNPPFSEKSDGGEFTRLFGRNARPPVAPPNLNLAPAQAGAGMSRLSDQSKLIIFFAVLAILSVVLVVAFAVTQKT
jgi:hypothetical protein